MNKKLHYKSFITKSGKIIVLVLLCCIASVSQTYAESGSVTIQQIMQQKRVTLDLKNQPIKVILQEMKRQSGISFMFKDEADLSSLSSLSINVKNETVVNALKVLFANTNFTYDIVGDTVNIVKKSVVKVTQKKISANGIVVDKSGKPVVGATVIVSATANGAITDQKGEFILNNVNVGDKVEVSFMGMKSQIVTVPDTFKIVVHLETDAVAIEDVIVNGVFERKANSFTGSVTTIKSDDLKRVSNSNALQALRNLDPSIMFYDNMEFGSDPNRLPEMSIRGKSNLNIDDNNLRTFQNDPNAPLFVLDGFEVSMQKIMDLDMDRIETMTILKDASAKAIYGAKAANGVIVIELKKNASGKLRVTYNGSVDIQAPDLSSYNLTNAREKLEIERLSGQFDDNEQTFNTVRTLNQLYNQRLTLVESGIDTDWISKPLRTGVGTKHGVSVDLGTDALKTIIDLSYQNVKGTMKGSDRTNIAGAITVSYRHKKFLFKDQLTITSNTSNDSKYGNFDEYTKLNPYYTPYDAFGQISSNIVPELTNLPNDITVGAWYKNVKFQPNPLYNAGLNTLLQEKYIDVTNNFELQYFATDALKLTLRFGLSEQRNKSDNFYPANHLKFKDMKEDEAFRKGTYGLINGQESNISGKFDLQYSKEFLPKNMIYANAGYELSQKSLNQNETNAEGFPSDKMTDIMFAMQYAKDGKPTGNEQKIRDLGYYISANYSYDNRINVDAIFRQSASSMYGAKSRWGIFWSTGLSWNLNNESWLKGTAVSKLRVRATIGSTGSQSTAAYNGIASYKYFLDQNYEGLLAAQLVSMKNDDLKWQEKIDKNIGLDFAIRNSLSVTFDYYHATTNNTVNPLTLSPSTGFLTVQENVGKVKNTGFDVKVRYTVWERPADRSSLTFSVGLLNNKSTLLEISDAMKNYNTSQNNKYEKPGLREEDLRPTKPVLKYYDGVSMDAIWAMRSLGIDPANGREIYYVKGADGNYFRTYDYIPELQEICGNSADKIYGNASINFEYKGFGFNAVFRYKFGAQMYNSTLVDKVENANLSYNVDKRIYTDRWRNPGDISQYKAINTDNVSAAYVDKTISDKTLATSRFVQDRDELSLSSLQFSYDFFRYEFVKKMGMERIRVAVTANELFTVSSIKIERGTSYPFARNFNASLSFTF